MHYDTIIMEKSTQPSIMSDAESALLERRISDLLRSEFIDQIGFDPNQLQRRASTPIKSYFNLPEYNKRRASIQNVKKIKGFYSVLMDGKKYHAFSQIDLGLYEGGVLVQDGSFIRSAHIDQTIKREECEPEALKIVCQVDAADELNDTLNGMTQIAFALADSYVKSMNCDAHVVHVDVVSYEHRALLRVQLSNLNISGIDGLIRHLVQIFSIAVEIHD